MTNAILDYFGKPASSLLTSPPFESWKFKRTVDNDLPEIRIDYVSARNKFSFICDVDEKIDSIFIEADNLDRSLLDISFSLSRNDVLRILGVPSKSGAARRDPFWVNTALGTASTRRIIQYISHITLMQTG
ncbi:hypothetical protein [Mesorhizobium sp. AA22]|uniref:hypothetical protein n=1 Tax=Mesorhizobium sp. AA22 TaxID=1854057 RepID=UPI0007ECF5BE|nr:hypothetical protein [Mesorhizobium sp. AA22]QIA23174.1 hypothetical protein A9K68_016355 [Mesorhizobium sp. AA22]